MARVREGLLLALLLAPVDAPAVEVGQVAPALTVPSMDPRQQISLSDYRGKVVLVKGRVTEVCAKMGCWMQLTDAGKAVLIKVNDGEIVFPQSAIGKTAVAEGKLTRLELTKEQAVARAKHEAEERGTKFDPATVKSGATIYQIQGTGAVILD